MSKIKIHQQCIFWGKKFRTFPVLDNLGRNSAHAKGKLFFSADLSKKPVHFAVIFRKRVKTDKIWATLLFSLISLIRKIFSAKRKEEIQSWKKWVCGWGGRSMFWLEYTLLKFILKVFLNIWICRASERCQQEKRKTINGEDILFAMTTLGFDNYVEPLKVYLTKYREVISRIKSLIVFSVVIND